MRKPFCLLVILIVCTLRAMSQELVGKITDSDSAATALYQAEITQSQGGKVIATYKTYFDGSYHLKVRPSQVYQIKATYGGRKDSTVNISVDKNGMLVSGSLVISLYKNGLRLMGYVLDREEDIPIKDAGILIRNVMTRKEDKYFTDVNGYYNLKMDFETNYTFKIDKRSPGIINKYQDTSFNISTIGFNQAMDFRFDIKLGPAEGFVKARPQYDPYAAPDNKNLKPVVQVVGKKDSLQQVEQQKALAELDKKLNSKDSAIASITKKIDDINQGKKDEKTALNADGQAKKLADEAKLKAEKDKQAEVTRKEQDKAEAALKAKQEKEAADKLRKEQEAAAQAKLEKQKNEKLTAEKVQKEKEATDKLRKEQEAVLKAKQEKEAADKLRTEQEEAAQTKLEKQKNEKLTAEKVQQEKEAAGKLRKEQEDAAQAKLDKERQDKLAADKTQKEKDAADKLRKDQEDAMQAKLDKEKQDKLAADKVQKDKEAAAIARLIKENKEKLIAEKEKEAADKLRKQQEDAALIKLEKERKEKLAAEKRQQEADALRAKQQEEHANQNDPDKAKIDKETAALNRADSMLAAAKLKKERNGKATTTQTTQTKKPDPSIRIVPSDSVMTDKQRREQRDQDLVKMKRAREEAEARMLAEKRETEAKEKAAKKESRRIAKELAEQSKQRKKAEEQAKRMTDEQQRIAAKKTQSDQEQNELEAKRAHEEQEKKNLISQREKLLHNQEIPLARNNDNPEPTSEKAVRESNQKKAITDYQKKIKDEAAVPGVVNLNAGRGVAKQVKTRGYVKNGQTEDPLSNVSINIRRLNGIVSQEVSSDDNGNYSFTVDSGYFYLVSFYKDKYEISKQILDLTSYKKQEYTMLIQYLKEHDEFDPASRMPMIQFEKNSSKVPEGLWSDLEPIVKMMQEVPQLKMKIYGLGSADEDYPMELSITRARLVADMMMEVGIKPGRLRINGVGAFRPRSGCVEGKQCTQEQYKMDRVVMYKVIKD